MVLGLSACPDDCEEGSTELQLVGQAEDPHLGSFAGSLTWLQTDEPAELELALSRPASTVTQSCGRAQVEVGYQLTSSDGLVTRRGTMPWSVDRDGFLIARSWQFQIDAAALIDGNKLPEAPGIAERQPVALVFMDPQPGGTWSVRIAVRSSSDELSVAAASLERSTP
jgi:hypothetical protein